MRPLLVFPFTWCQDRAKGGIPFEEPAVLECFSQVCDAVCFVHQLKMVHRDIKSRNVFLCRTWFWRAFSMFLFFPPVPGARFLIYKNLAQMHPKASIFYYTQNVVEKAQFWWLPKQNLVGGNSKIFYFHPGSLGKMNPIWLIFFQRGWFNHQQKQHPQGPAVRSWVTLVWYDYWSPPVTWHTPVWERPITSVLSFLDKNHQGEGRWNIDLS